MKNMEQQRYDESGFFVLFPTHLLEMITHRQCIVCGIIMGMAKRSGFAYIGNSALAEMVHVSIDTLQRDLAEIESKGLIIREIIRNEKNEVIQRRLFPLPLLMSPHECGKGPRTSAVGGGGKSAVGSPHGCGIYKDNNININNINIIDSNGADRIDELFELIWVAYHKRGNKKTARTAFRRLTKPEMKQVMEHIQSYVENHANAKKMDFLPHLTTYINQKRWLDELPYQKLDKKSAVNNVNWD
jgi:DNA-binding Lrp family transcriptional regulator